MRRKAQLKLKLHQPSHKAISILKALGWKGWRREGRTEEQVRQDVMSGEIKSYKHMGPKKISILEDYFGLPQTYTMYKCATCGHETYEKCKRAD